MLLTMTVCDHWHASDQIEAEVDLDVVIEDEVVVAVPLQEGPGMLLVEILKLQHCLGPPRQHSCHKLIHQLQPQVVTCCKLCNTCTSSIEVKQHATDLCVTQSHMRYSIQES